MLRYRLEFSIEDIVHLVNIRHIKRENIISIALAKNGKQYYILYWDEI